MTEVNRRTILRGAAAIGLSMPAIIASNQAWAAKLRLKYGISQPDDYPHTVHMREAAAAILAESNGEVTLDIFPSSQLGGDTDMLSQVRSGALEFMTISGLILSVFVPATAIHGMAYVWRDSQHVWGAIDGDLGRYERDQMAKSGLYAFDTIWDTGFRQITASTRPINTPDDLNGFKIRVAVSPLWTSLFKALGASPVSLGFAEVYMALQTQIADGQENAPAVIEANKFYEVQKYLSLTSHIWDGNWFITGQRTWNRLPGDVQALVKKHVEQSAKTNRADITQLNDSLVAKLKERGMAVNSIDREPFRAKLQNAGFYREWKDKFGTEGWDILEKYTGKIT